ncbi:MAG: GTP-binding protein [bacterium]|nr:GTP-binding protein [bacterium]
MQSNIRNFCIIAHIDHGKSTLADRLLEFTGTVEKRKMKEQMLDMMDLERERGITIKLQPVRMNFSLLTTHYILNLIDTPGHVDFNYEVSRSLAAVEGAILLVDATQGVQAQTIGNLYLAVEQNLTIIPVINKIDLPNAQIERVKAEIVHLLGCQENEILLVSAKTGQGVAELLEAVVEKIPPPKILLISPFVKGGDRGILRALIFDSKYDEYRGVVAYGRVVDGEVRAGQKIYFLAQKEETEVLEVGYFKPNFVKADKLQAGEIGYIVTDLKDVSACRVGDTITSSSVIANHPLVVKQSQGIATPRAAGLAMTSIEPLPGYKEVKPMVFAGIFPKEGNDFTRLREAVAKLKLNDAAFFFEPERSTALGFGLRCGFLGLLHLEIIKERLRREYNLELVVTTPSVAYKVKEKSGAEKIIKGALEMPDYSKIESIEEPWVKTDILTPAEYIGSIMQLAQEKRGIYQNTEYLAGSAKNTSDRVILHYEIPLSSILTDFYDKLKSASSGYASLNYEFLNYRPADIVRLDILVAEEKAEALSTLIIRDEAQRAGRQIVETLKNNIPKQMFEVKIQAALGGTIIASERLSAMRKDVLAKMSGGDWTRKAKLLAKQKKGKKAMKAGGHVDIPAEAYLAVLKR